jgi:hypothetical protein
VLAGLALAAPGWTPAHAAGLRRARAADCDAGHEQVLRATPALPEAFAQARAAWLDATTLRWAGAAAAPGLALLLVHAPAGRAAAGRRASRCAQRRAGRRPSRCGKWRTRRPPQRSRPATPCAASATSAPAPRWPWPPPTRRACAPGTAGS